jgi:hypothetical protein
LVSEAGFLLHGAEILYVSVGAEARVVRQVPAGMIGIFVDHDVIRVPHPVIHVRNLPRSDAPVPVVYPETAGIAAFHSPAVLGAESAFVAAVLPRPFFVKAPIVAVLVVAYPHSSVVHVGSIGMTRLIAVFAAAFVLIVTGLVVVALIVIALLWVALRGTALIHPVLVWPGLLGPGLFLSGLFRAGLLCPVLVLTGSAVIGFRPALRRRSDRMGGWVVICLILVLVFLPKCRG